MGQQLFTYPKALFTRGGCKVSWMYFADREDAEKASEVARKEAVFVSNLGYDFGYCSPGSITETKDGYEVCIP